MTSEIWKPIFEYEGRYEVSSLGRVKSLPRTKSCPDGRVMPVVGGIMSLSDDGHGYMKCLLRKNGKAKSVKVHRLVVEAFIGSIEKGKVTNHKDRNRKNNKIDNLEIVTVRENVTHGKLSKNRFTGAAFHKKSGQWTSRLSIKGKINSLGYFDTEAKASKAYHQKLKSIGEENRYAR